MNEVPSGGKILHLWTANDLIIKWTKYVKESSIITSETKQSKTKILTSCSGEPHGFGSSVVLGCGMD